MTDEIKEKINNEVRDLAAENEKTGIVKKYLDFLARMEEKYNTLGYVPAPVEQ